MKRAIKLLVLLGIIGVILLVPIINRLIVGTEGFAVSNPRCPVDYKFFTDKRGESFCCKGSVDPTKHTCSATGLNDLCAMRSNVKDPRDSSRFLPFCGSLITEQSTAAATVNCPPTLPYYATDGTNAKCCRTAANLDGNDCIPGDLADKKRYCRVSGTLQTGEQRCSTVRMFAEANCPRGLQKVSYTLGSREAAKYSGASGTIPVCIGINHTCIPEQTLNAIQDNGIFTDKSKATWKYSCDVFTKRILQGDLTDTITTEYLDSTNDDRFPSA